MSSLIRSMKPGALATWLAIAVAAAAGVACAVALALWFLPRGSNEVWEWRLRTEPIIPVPWAAGGLLSTLIVSLVGLDAMRSGASASRLKATLVIIGLTVSCGVTTYGLGNDDAEYPFRASGAILGDNSMGYYLEAHRVDDARAWIADVEHRTTRGNVPERVATHPPGPVLYYWAAREYLLSHPDLLDGLRRRFERRAGKGGLEAATALARRVSTLQPDDQDVVIAFWAGLALTLTAPLIIPVMFALGSVSGGPRLGMVSAVLGACVPSLLCFNPSVDGPSAVAAAGVVMLWIWALRSRMVLPGLLCGLLWAGGLSWTFGLLALASVMGIIALVWWRELGAVGRPWRAAGCVLAGVAIGVCAGAVALSYNPLPNLVRSLQVQSEIMQQRPYGLSVLWNLYDFALFAGPSVLLVSAMGAIMAASPTLKPRVVAAQGLAILVTLALLAITARTRGEVGRIWGFLMPLAIPPCGVPLLRLRGWGLMSAGMLLVGGQLALAVAINSYLILVAP